MSSTDKDTRDEARVRRVFHEQLVPAARALRERGIELLTTGPDDEETWWCSPGSTPDFVTLEAEGLEGALRELWSEDELPELHAVAGLMAELARSLEVRDQEDDSVSDLVYVMY